MGAIIALVMILILTLLAQGCVRPTESPAPAADTPLPTLSPRPPLTATPTLELLDQEIVYLVVGLSSQGTLPIYREPSPNAEIIRQIPAAGKSIRTTGQEVEAEGISWLQIVYQGSAGWVDASHLARQYGDGPEELVALAQDVTAALRGPDFLRLSDLVHPVLCLRFSPYPYLQESDQVFCPDELIQLPGSGTLFTWGRHDGSGEPIELTFDAYRQRFVYDQDFFLPEVVGLNQEVSSGNAINNIPEIFPDGMIVEYHFPGFDPQYGGMDWRSLRMVFVQEKGGWYLAALVHGEWTI